MDPRESAGRDEDAERAEASESDDLDAVEAPAAATEGSANDPAATLSPGDGPEDDDAAPAAPAERRLALTPLGTLVCSVGLVLIAVVFIAVALTVPRGPDSFEEPIASTARFFERELHLFDALHESLPEPLVTGFFWGDREELLRLAIDALEEASKAEHDPAVEGRATARIAILLGESGMPEDGLARLRRQSSLLEHEEFPDVFAAAYGLASGEAWRDLTAIEEAIETLVPSRGDHDRGEPQSPAGARGDDRARLVIDRTAAGDSWTACRLVERLLALPDVPGRQDLAEFVAAGRQAGRNRARGLVALLATYAAVVLAGLVVATVWLVRRRRPLCDEALLPPPWSLRLGYAAFARIAVFSTVVMIGITTFVLTSNAARAWSVAIFALVYPVSGIICLAYFYLALVPVRHTLSSTFGLRGSLAPARWKSLAVATLGFFALDQLGGAIIYSIASDGSEWAEGIAEDLLHGGGITRGIWYFDAVISAPVVEELVCRGLIYATLRTRLGVFPSAVVSALLFTLPHVYSAAGLLVIAWTGLVLAFAYERTRSLLVCIGVHAAHNLLISVQFELSYV